MSCIHSIKRGPTSTSALLSQEFVCLNTNTPALRLQAPLYIKGTLRRRRWRAHPRRSPPSALVPRFGHATVVSWTFLPAWDRDVWKGMDTVFPPAPLIYGHWRRNEVACLLKRKASPAELMLKVNWDSHQDQDRECFPLSLTCKNNVHLFRIVWHLDCQQQKKQTSTL